jgi:predicted pyridoxine 5'-phosphate oxidase superfamily flavin-nucleotide-binding protein
MNRDNSMPVPKKLFDVLKHEGVVAIATQGADGRPHLVNTWNSYVQVTGDELLLIPAGGMNRTQKNVSENTAVLLTLGSREVEGLRGPGTGFLITGTAEFLSTGVEFETVKNKFPWARAALKIAVGAVEQTL